MNVNPLASGSHTRTFGTGTVLTPFNLDVHALVAKDRAYINRCKSLNGSVLRYISTKNTAPGNGQSSY